MKINDIQFNKDKLFFTSDTHFGHSNIIKYCKRPFENSQEMDSALVEKWNSIVPKDGVVFHLGDFALNHSNKSIQHIINSLNGSIHLVVGNHERCALSGSYIKSLWSSISDIAEIQVEDDEITYGKQHIIMCHYPMLTWNGSHRGSWQLFGHVHGGLSNKGTINHHPAQMDVGVDCHDFTPISYQQVKEKITEQLMNK